MAQSLLCFKTAICTTEHFEIYQSDFMYFNYVIRSYFAILEPPFASPENSRQKTRNTGIMP